MPNVVIQFDGYEYRVPGPSGTEAQAYYTSDKQDAIGTARHMWKDQSLNPSFRRVQEFKNKKAFEKGQMKAMNAIDEKMGNAVRTPAFIEGYKAGQKYGKGSKTPNPYTSSDGSKYQDFVYGAVKGSNDKWQGKNEHP